MRSRLNVLRLPLAGLLVISLVAPALAGKPGGGGTTPPTVHFQTLWLGAPMESFDVNDVGQIVGRFTTNPSRAFVATINASAGTAVVSDLNTLSSTWIDSASGAAAPGWTARGAGEIDDHGRIVGRAVDGNGFERAFLYAPDAAGAWTFYLLPPVPGYEAHAMVATGINNFGQVVGKRYDPTLGRRLFAWDEAGGTRDLGVAMTDLASINDAGVAVGDQSSASVLQSFRYHVGTAALDILAVGASEACINNAGQIAGRRAVGRKGEQETIRFSQTDLSDVIVIDTSANGATQPMGINDNGDVVYPRRVSVNRTLVTKLFLWQDGQPQPIDLFSLADQPLSSSGRAAVSDANATTDPEGTGFGLVAATAHDGSGTGYVLIPRQPSP